LEESWFYNMVDRDGEPLQYFQEGPRILPLTRLVHMCKSHMLYMLKAI
jgi:hypothetical protein